MSTFISILYDSKTYRNCTQFDAMPQIPGLSKALSHQSEARELITAMWDSIVFITPQIYIEPSLAAYRQRERERERGCRAYQDISYCIQMAYGVRCSISAISGIYQGHI